jgi:farnesyl diphosphate synthase
VNNAEFLKKAMKTTADAVEAQLEKFLPLPEGGERRLFEAMRYSLLAGGKRLRPFLVVGSADLFGVDKKHSLRVAAAIECIHTYSLIHDDLPAMDNDDLRRGKPTLHKAYDEATAILAGDGLLTLAFEILANPATHPNAQVRCELITAIAKSSGIHGMVGGQAIDLAAENLDLNIGEVTRLQQMKTGALIAFSTEAGAILGQATSPQRQLLQGYAHDLGLAFQIADDLLDHEGTPEETGKATQKDADRGKATFVSLMGAEQARQQAAMLASQAAEHVRDFGDKAILLRSLAQYVVERRK